MRGTVLAAAALSALIGLAPRPVAAADTCPISAAGLDDAKPNKLYLYFPAADDASFPEFGQPATGISPGFKTSPAAAFAVSKLGNFTGTAAQLRDAITKVVAASYCEFNVQVLQTATPPPASVTRRNTVAVGTDFVGPCNIIQLGQAESADIGDHTAVDFGRIFAGGYQQCAGSALKGANSTLERWARAIGGSAAHEAGHNFGLRHTNAAAPAPGEDVRVHHIMLDYSHLTFEQRADYRRHFSNKEYSLLAANVGLSVQTMWNWSLVNPDAGTGVKLQMEFLSQQPSLLLSWTYNGSKSPWINPTLSGPSGTQTFKGVTYKKYRLEWSTGHAWNGPTPGHVDGGMAFQLGATFSSVNVADPDPIIVTNITLLDASNNPLPLHPRVAAFDTGTPELVDNVLALRLFNFGEPLQIRRLHIQQMPRLVSLDNMTTSGKLLDLNGLPTYPWTEGVQPDVVQRMIEKNGEFKVTMARLNQPPHVTDSVTERDCNNNADGKRGDGKCRPGVQVDLFPSTSVLVTAELVDPNARHWDPTTKKYVMGPVTTTVTFQIRGRRRPGRGQ
jgi:hypothetical protein